MKLRSEASEVLIITVNKIWYKFLGYQITDFFNIHNLKLNYEENHIFLRSLK